MLLRQNKLFSPAFFCTIGTRTRIILLLCLLLLLTGGEVLLYHTLHLEQGRDSVLYLEIITWWHQGGFNKVIKSWRSFFWLPPLYFYVSHLLMYLGLSAESAGVLVSMLCGTAIPLITFGITYEITKKINLSSAAAFLIAVNPVLIETACCVQRDVPYLCLCASALYFFIAGIRRNSWFWFLLSGMFCAASFLTRYETIELFPAVILYTSAALLFKHSKWYWTCRNFLLFFTGGIIAAALFFTAMDTPDAKLIKTYQIYYRGKWRHFLSLYKTKIPVPVNTVQTKQTPRKPSVKQPAAKPQNIAKSKNTEKEGKK